MANIRIVIVEDQQLMCDAMATLLGLEPDFDVIATAQNGLDGLHKVRALAPDIVLTDIEMPALSGLDLAHALREHSTRVVIVTTFDRAGYLRRAFESSVAGYLLKDSPGDGLASAIRTVAAGGRVIEPELALAAWEQPDPLGHRERRVLRLVEKGLSNAAIAETLRLKVGTVKNYISEALGKLGAGNRTEAVKIARERGWL